MKSLAVVRKRGPGVSLWDGEKDARQLAAACRMVLSKVGGSREELGLQVWAPSTWVTGVWHQGHPSWQY